VTNAALLKTTAPGEEAVVCYLPAARKYATWVREGTGAFLGAEGPLLGGRSATCAIREAERRTRVNSGEVDVVASGSPRRAGADTQLVFFAVHAVAPIHEHRVVGPVAGTIRTVEPVGLRVHVRAKGSARRATVVVGGHTLPDAIVRSPPRA